MDSGCSDSRKLGDFGELYLKPGFPVLKMEPLRAVPPTRLWEGLNEISHCGSLDRHLSYNKHAMKVILS